jgi:hypothetical protein
MATAVTLTARNTQTQMALTTAEDTLTFTEGTVAGGEDRLIELVCDAAWGISHATGAFGTKKPIPAGTPFRINLASSPKVYYVHVGTGTGTLSIWPL